jgi:hypothetical protein
MQGASVVGGGLTPHDAVNALQQDMVAGQVQTALDVELTSLPLPPTPPSTQLLAGECAAAIKVARLEYFKAHHCRYTAGVMFGDPADPNYQFTLEEMAARAYIRAYAARAGTRKGAPDFTAAAASEEAAGMLPTAVFTSKLPLPLNVAPIQTPPAWNVSWNTTASGFASSLSSRRRSFLGREEVGEGKPTHDMGSVLAISVGENSLSFALAAAKAMEGVEVPGVSRLFEGWPEAYVRLEHAKRKITGFHPGRLRLVGSFVGTVKEEVDMAPPPAITQQEWNATAFFGANHRVHGAPDNLRLRQITSDAALPAAGGAVIMSVDPELTSGVLEVGASDPLAAYVIVEKPQSKLA